MKCKNMERYTNWIFDLDGTLVDSAPDIVGLLREVLEEEGLDGNQIHLEMIGPLLEDIIQSAYPDCTPEKLADIVKRYRAKYTVSDYPQSFAYSGIPPLLTRLLERHCRLYVATNKPEGVTQRLLEKCGLLSLFDDIVCSNSFAGRTLSKTEMIHHLMQKHVFTATSAVMVGDTLLDMEGGKGAEVDTVAALYGYGNSELLLQTQPTFVVKDAAWQDIQ